MSCSALGNTNMCFKFLVTPFPIARLPPKGGTLRRFQQLWATQDDKACMHSLEIKVPSDNRICPVFFNGPGRTSKCIPYPPSAHLIFAGHFRVTWKVSSAQCFHGPIRQCNFGTMFSRAYQTMQWRSRAPHCSVETGTPSSHIGQECWSCSPVRCFSSLHR